jgi:hypothetical protein
LNAGTVAPMSPNRETHDAPFARTGAVRHHVGDVPEMLSNGVPAWSPARRRRTLLEALCLFVLVLSGYLLNGHAISSGDATPNRYLPVSILRDGSFYLDGFPFLYSPELPYYVRHFRGRYVSSYPVTGAVLAVPIYLPAVLRGEAPESPVWEELEKTSAAVIVALSAVFLFLALVRLTTLRMALLVTGAYAFGTSSLSVSSQALWQHGPSQLGLAAALYFLVKGRARGEAERWIAVSGFALAFAVISRPTDLLLALPLGIYVLLHYPKQVGPLLLFALPPMGFQLWYNATYQGNPFWTQVAVLQGEHWTGRFSDGLLGLLFSPGRGLFIYSPIFLFSIVTLAMAWRRGGDPLLRAAGVGALLVVFLYGRWWPWWGGHTFGPRLLADITPLLALALYPLRDGLNRSPWIKAAFAVALLWSVGAHSIGAFWDDIAWNAYPLNVDRVPQRLWSWTDNQLVNPVYGRVTTAVKQKLGIPVPVGALLERYRREKIESEPWSDRAINALRGEYELAKRTDGVAEMERLEVERFTPETKVGWDFAGLLTLVGYDLRPVGPRAFDVTYYWRARQKMRSDYAAFVHFERPGSTFQDDHILGVPVHRTGSWETGETVKVTRRVIVPESAAAGAYSMRLGVWEPRNGEHLFLREGWWRRSKAGMLIRLEVSADGSIRAESSTAR